MTEIKNYNFSESELVHIVVDTANGQYLWCLFANNLKKVSAHNPLQTYFDIDQDEVLVRGFISGSYIYLAVNDASLIGKRYSLSNPVSTSTDFSLPAGITEAPIDVVASGSDLFFLIPGIASGENAKIVKMSTAGVYDQTIDLATVANAVSFTYDGTDLWVITNETPAEYIRVYFDGIWKYTVNS